MKLPSLLFVYAKIREFLYAIYLFATRPVRVSLGYNRKGDFVQVLYLVRYPIIFGGLLIAFPLIAISVESHMMGNLFVFTSFWPVFLVTVVAISLAWSVMYTFFLAVNGLLDIYPELHNFLDESSNWPASRWLVKYRIVLFTLLAAPVMWVSIAKAEMYDSLLGWDRGWAIAGVLSALLAAILFYGFCLWAQSQQWMKRLLKRIALITNAILDFLHVPKSARTGFGYLENSGFRHETAAVFVSLLVVLNFAGAIIFQPTPHLITLPTPAPATVYLLFFLILLTWIFSCLAHVVDRYRVPTSFLLLLLILGMAQIGDTYHYYEIMPRKTPIPVDEAALNPCKIKKEASPAASQELAPATAMQAALEVYTATIPFPEEIYAIRQANQAAQLGIDNQIAGIIAQNEQPPTVGNAQPPVTSTQPLPMVVIMASGGGIKSAVWTSKILTGLQHQIGKQFANAIGLISAVSGGSVGAMFYVDGFTCTGPPPDETLKKIVDTASFSTVEQAAWGLIYPDFRRVFYGGLGVIGKRFADRSAAMQAAWQGRLQDLANIENPAIKAEIEAKPKDERTILAGIPVTETLVMSDEVRTLSDWQVGVTQGWRPVTIFGATEAETGRRFLFAPANIPDNWMTRSFYNAFPGYDVPVATAARMSATFPYVSPLARAYLSDDDNITVAARLGFTPTEAVTSPTGIVTRQPVTHTEWVQNWNLADGGYYDNDGVMTALQWLEMILDGHDPKAPPPQRVVLIQILASGRETSIERCDDGKAEQPYTATNVYSLPDKMDQAAPKIAYSWVDEFFGPILTLLSSWGTSQVERSQVEIDHFINLKRMQYPDLRILYCTFDLRDSDVLSWQLSPSEFSEIVVAYEGRPVQRRIEQIQEFLGKSYRYPAGSTHSHSGR